MFSTIPFFITKTSSGPGPAPGPWTPANLPGIENWFKSDVGITLNGSNVSAWQDSLTSKSVIQATAVRQPGFTSSDANFNGLPSINFANTSSPSFIFLQNDVDFSYSGTFPLYFFMVVRKNASTGSSYDFAGGGSDANIGGGSWTVNIGDAFVNGYAGATDGLFNSIGGTALNTTILAGLGLTTANLYTYFNEASTAKAGTFTASANPLFLIGGYDPSGAFNFNGSIAEVIITRGEVLSETDLSDLWDYVQTKYFTPAYDPDAQAYIDAVVAAGGTLSSPQQDAINTFYVDIKSDGIYSNLYFMHPFFGGNAASNAIEGINPGGAYDLDFYGSWTHGASGSYAAQNSSNYADTNFDLSTSGPSSVTTNWSFGYMMTDCDQSAAGYGYMGVGPGGYYMITGTAGNTSENYFGGQVYLINEAPQTGFINSVFRSASNAWVSGALPRGATASGGLVYSATQSSTYTQPSTPTTIYYNKINPNNFPTGGNYLFAWGGQYLDSTQMTNFLVHLNTLQTAFNRQIFV